MSPDFTIRISIADMVALRVRTRGAGNTPQPECLYQSLPLSALSLIATVPRGRLAVSIPQHFNFGGGYVITKSLPPERDCVVLVYALKPNRCYEGVKVLFQDKDYEIEEFILYADQWMKTHVGTMCQIPEKYACFAPSKEQWNVIRRDNGYMAVDASNFSKDAPADIVQERQGEETSGVIARIPVLESDRQDCGPLSYFERVGLTFDLHPNPRGNWISFEKFIEAQTLASLPPDVFATNLPGWLKRFAADAGMESWTFRPGMVFGDRIEWWGDRNRRLSEHEGIDFAEGLCSKAQVRKIPEGTPVRALDNGEIISILDDFLGKTILVRHPSTVNKDGSVLYTQYSHILPDVAAGSTIQKEQVVGRVGRLTESTAPVHFHLAAAWIPLSIQPDALTLDLLHPAFTPVTLIDLNKLIAPGSAGVSPASF